MKQLLAKLFDEAWGFISPLHRFSPDLNLRSYGPVLEIRASRLDQRIVGKVVFASWKLTFVIDGHSIFFPQYSNGGNSVANEVKIAIVTAIANEIEPYATPVLNDGGDPNEETQEMIMVITEEHPAPIAERQ